MKRATARVSAALEALDRAELRKTPQRVAIVRAFVDDTSHPTAQQIFDRLRRQMPTMSFATVYNTLAALERAGVCRTLRLSHDDSARFDPMVEPHDHAVCDGCGTVIDVPRLADKSELSEFRVRAVERVYRGDCQKCQSTRTGGS
jgi:Fe2+ or Zn2+ uptake regulation protein